MSFHKSCVIFSSLFLLVFMSACEPQRTSGKGLVLPEGSIENGKMAFIELGCIRCHQVAGVDTPPYDGESTILLLLGGKVRQVKTYGELVTSIVNPNHIISPAYLDKLKSVEKVTAEITSPMPTFNDVMTVAQLIDLVTFLDSHYEKMLPDYINSYQTYGAY